MGDRRGADRMFSFLFFVFLFSADLGEGDQGVPLRRLCWTGTGYRYTCKIPSPILRQRRTAAMTLRATCSGISNTITHPNHGLSPIPVFAHPARGVVVCGGGAALLRFTGSNSVAALLLVPSLTAERGFVVDCWLEKGTRSYYIKNLMVVRIHPG